MPDVINPVLHVPTSSAEQAWLNSLMDRMTDLNTARACLNLLLYGDSGVGKTVASVQIAQHLTPKEKNILYIDSGEGWVSLQNHPKLLSRVHRMTLSKSGQLEDIANAIQKKMGFFGTVGAVIVDEQFAHLGPVKIQLNVLIQFGIPLLGFAGQRA